MNIKTVIIFLILSATAAADQSITSQGITLAYTSGKGFAVNKGTIPISYNSLFLCTEPPWKSHWFYDVKHKPLVIVSGNTITIKSDPEIDSGFNLEYWETSVVAADTIRIKVRGQLNKNVPAFITHVAATIPAEAFIAGQAICDNSKEGPAEQTTIGPFNTCMIANRRGTLEIKILSGPPMTLQDRRNKPYLGAAGFILIEGKKINISHGETYEQAIEISYKASGAASVQSGMKKSILREKDFFSESDSTQTMASIVQTERAYDGKYTWNEYRTILQELTKDRYQVMPLDEFSSNTCDNRIIVGMRHDIDSHPEKALTMAELEKKAGIRSTYFFLHSAGYYGIVKNNVITRNAVIDDLAKTLYRNGFEIGIHSDLFTMMWNYHFDPAGFIRGEIAYYKSLGITITGSAAHGNANVIKAGLNNMWAHAEFGKKGTAEANNEQFIEINGDQLKRIPLTLRKEIANMSQKVLTISGTDTGTVLTSQNKQDVYAVCQPIYSTGGKMVLWEFNLSVTQGMISDIKISSASGKAIVLAGLSVISE